MPVLKFMLSSLLLLSTTSCSPFEVFQDMGNKQEQFNELSVNNLGAKADISWNITNGKLTYITVIYPAKSLNNVLVSKVESDVETMVREIYGDESYQISVSVNLVGE